MTGPVPDDWRPTEWRPAPGPVPPSVDYDDWRTPSPPAFTLKARAEFPEGYLEASLVVDPSMARRLVGGDARRALADLQGLMGRFLLPLTADPAKVTWWAQPGVPT